MDHSTNLQQLPPGLVFPGELQARVRYDAARRQLQFRGFMSKYVHDQLVGLSSDIEYHRAVEHLFVLSAEGVVPPDRGRRMWRYGIGILVVLVASVIAIWALRASGAATDSPSSATPPDSVDEAVPHVDAP